MSDDIVKRLRNGGFTVKHLDQAADEIERLRAELAAANEDGERLVELSQANVRRLETAKAERDGLRALLREAGNLIRILDPRDAFKLRDRIYAALNKGGEDEV